MGKPPRTADELRPHLLDIHRIWQRMRAAVSTPGRLWTLFQIATIMVILVGAVTVGVFEQSTGVRREVSSIATWRISRIEDTRIIHFSFSEFPEFAEESVISEPLVAHLTATRPSHVTVTMVVIYDFGIARTKGPTLIVDGIRLDD